MAGRAEIDKDKVLQAEIRRAKRPAMVRASEGLYLQLGETGAASWLFRYQIAGKRRAQGLGPYPERTLAEARAMAADARKLVSNGIDPIEHRAAEAAAEAARKAQEAARAITFDVAAADYIAVHGEGWKNAKHRAQWEDTLATYASPKIGALPLEDITTDHVLAILSPIWSTKNETASRVRGRIEQILDAAKVKGLRSGENPARWRGHLDKLLPKRSRVRKVRHMPALPWKEMPTFWPDLCASSDAGSIALQFTVLTACRTGEVLGAEWVEFDLDAQTWVIPGSRMKAGRQHRVPLSDAAVAILRAQQAKQAKKRRWSKWVFPGRSGDAPLSGMVMLMTLRRLKEGKYRGVTPHGFRSTFRDWCAETTHYPRDVCEMALAHAIESDVEASYRRGDLLERRRELMTDWAAYVTTKLPENVVQLDAARASA